jgi:hypothetical protein
LECNDNQQEDPSPDGKMMSGMTREGCNLLSGQNMSKIALNGRLLLRKPRLYQSCSAEEEED